MPLHHRNETPRRGTGLKTYLVGVWLLCCCNAGALASTLFESDAVLDATLTGPISSLVDDPESREELPFVLTADGIDHAIAVRTRGNSRLQVCNFPPLRLDFVQKATAGTLFEGHNKLKLVTHCRNGDRGEQDMLEEYLVYRLFNVLSDSSFQVRLMRINYVDTDGELDGSAAFRYAFVLEPEDQLAARLGGEPAEMTGVPVRRHDVAQASLLYLFQYMIGNTDWGFVKADYDDECCHNVYLVETNGVIRTIPYDFDLTGLVNARYARPDPLLRIKTVRQRLYRGLCAEPEQVLAAVDELAAKRERLLAMPAGIPGLADANVKKAERYLADFFELAGDREKLVRRFERSCL